MTLEEYLTARGVTPTKLQSSQVADNLISLYALVDDSAISKLPEELQKVETKSYTYYCVFTSNLVTHQLTDIAPYLSEEEGVELYMQMINKNKGE